MTPEALNQLIEDFEAFKEAGNLLYQRLTEVSSAIAATQPIGEAERVLLEHLQSHIDGAIARMGTVRGNIASGGAASSIYLALCDLRKTPEFATAFEHVRRSKSLLEEADQRNGRAAALSE